jgi:hypothetical protein
MIVKAYYKKGEETKEIISPPKFDYIDNVDFLLVSNTMNVNFNNDLYNIADSNKTNSNFDYTKIYGDFEYVVEITNMSNDKKIFTSITPNFSFEIEDEGMLKIKAYTRYAKIPNLTSNIYEEDYFSLFVF